MPVTTVVDRSTGCVGSRLAGLGWEAADLAVVVVIGLHTSRVGTYTGSAEQEMIRGQARPRASHCLPHHI
eukprot:354498-Chlamydomonas_euryale.AAC.4